MSAVVILFQLPFTASVHRRENSRASLTQNIDFKRSMCPVQEPFQNVHECSCNDDLRTKSHWLFCTVILLDPGLFNGCEEQYP